MNLEMDVDVSKVDSYKPVQYNLCYDLQCAASVNKCIYLSYQYQVSYGMILWDNIGRHIKMHVLQSPIYNNL